jgi:hypothetical protein
MAIVAWQGWRLDLPPRWNPVKLEGDYRQGYALLADLHRPRLGLRWRTLTRKQLSDPAAWTAATMKQEVGSLAAAEAIAYSPPDDSGSLQSPMLYVEPDPPGRDVFLAISKPSGRGVELIHHAHRRERILAEAVLPGFADLPADRAMPWSIFELSCIAPAGFVLQSHRLNAGDLSLTFAGTGGNRNQWILVRQVAVAQLALGRMALDRWLVGQQRARQRHYKPSGDAQKVEISLSAGGLDDLQSRPVSGWMAHMRRRRRFVWLARLVAQITTVALHDEQRDRLVFVQGTDEALLRQIAGTVGWAADGKRQPHH